MIDPYRFSEGGNDASDYDGSTGYFTRTSDLIGNSDSKKMMFSKWFISRADGATQRIMHGNTGAATGYSIFKFSDDSFILQTKDSSNTVVVALTSQAIASDALWHHMLWGFDTTTGVVENYFYLDGVAQSLTVNIFTTDGVTDFTKDDHWIGGIGANYFNGCFYNSWFGPGEFLSGADAVAAFYGGGSPPNLGANGNVPTGNQPLVFSPSSEFASDQQGSGGVYTKVGTVGACATVPA